MPVEVDGLPFVIEQVAKHRAPVHVRPPPRRVVHLLDPSPPGGGSLSGLGHVRLLEQRLYENLEYVVDGKGSALIYRIFLAESV